jgi:hypothetical protein
MKMIEKSKLNFLIDAVMFLCMMAIASLGFLMKFVLPPGRERVAKYGNAELSLFGMDRHEWGTIHLYLAIAFFIVLALHVVLHWKLIVGLFERLFQNRDTRRIVAPAFVGASLLLVIGPFLIKPTIRAVGPGTTLSGDGCLIQTGDDVIVCGGCDDETASPIGPAGAGRAASLDPNKTLNEISAQYDMPPRFLKKGLGMPESARDDATLTELQKKYDFEPEELQKIIQNYEGLRRRQRGGNLQN